jgi:hypothetical protein
LKNRRREKRRRRAGTHYRGAGDVVRAVGGLLHVGIEADVGDVAAERVGGVVDAVVSDHDEPLLSGDELVRAILDGDDITGVVPRFDDDPEAGRRRVLIDGAAPRDGEEAPEADASGLRGAEELVVDLDRRGGRGERGGDGGQEAGGDRQADEHLDEAEGATVAPG